MPWLCVGEKTALPLSLNKELRSVHEKSRTPGLRSEGCAAFAGKLGLITRTWRQVQGYTYPLRMYFSRLLNLPWILFQPRERRLGRRHSSPFLQPGFRNLSVQRFGCWNVSIWRQTLGTPAAVAPGQDATARLKPEVGRLSPSPLTWRRRQPESRL